MRSSWRLRRLNVSNKMLSKKDAMQELEHLRKSLVDRKTNLEGLPLCEGLPPRWRGERIKALRNWIDAIDIALTYMADPNKEIGR